MQIRELGQNVELEDIARKQDFGSRIRNACVIGLPSYDPSDTNEVYVKDEDDDFDMLDSVKPAHRGTLPPQLLVLVLEQGDLVFLYLEVAGFKNIIFVSHSEPIPDSRLVLPGYHLTVDPSSRYLTLACSETHFQVWQLEAMETLRARHDQGLPLRPVMGQPYPRALNGVIHKIEYLSPGAENDEQIILTMIIVHKGYSRIHKYDWELGDDLVAVLKDASVGWPLDQAIQMPLLVIPSTVRESFLLVTETSEAFWATLKNGGFEWEEVSIGEHDRTELHIGGAAPLWTAWSRPWRLPEYHLDKDTIWLAREDGILNFLEITAGDGLLTNVIMGEVECKIDTAFACLYDPYADILITSGDSGPGAIWKSDPRQPLKRIGTIPNWSPTVDLTSTHSDLQESKTSRNKTRSEINGHSKPDRVFACSGRGKTGSILEFRHGFEAHIGYELECGSPVKQCWQVRRPEGGSRDDFDLIVSRPDRTDVVRFAKGLDAFASMAQDQVPYDFSSTTLAVQELGIGPIVQVTTNSVTLVDITQPMSSKRYLCHEVTPGASTISNAAIGKGFIALAYHTGSAFCIQILRIEGLGVVQHASYKIEGEVTFMVFANLGINAVLLAGVWNEGSPTLVVFAAEPASSNGSSVSCAMPNTLELCRSKF